MGLSRLAPELSVQIAKYIGLKFKYIYVDKIKSFVEITRYICANEVVSDCLTLDLRRFAPIRNLPQHEARPIRELHQGKSTNHRLAGVFDIFLCFFGNIFV